MFFDNKNIFSDEQAYDSTGSLPEAGKDISGNKLVLELGGDDYSRMWIAIVLKDDVAITGAPNGVDGVVTVETNATDDTFSSGNVTLHTEKFALTNAKKGDTFAFRMPLGLLKYTRVVYQKFEIDGGTSPTVKTQCTIGITDGVQTA